MDVEQFLHMNAGDGKTSYANNSLLQRAVISMVQPIVDASIEKLCRTHFHVQCLKIADLGCSSGPNTLLVISNVIDKINDICQKLKHDPPALQVFLNDLPGNDFNTIFRSLPGFYKNLEEKKSKGSCFIAGVPGSFYGRLFPDKSLHFVHSSYCLHWISQVPKGLVTKEGEGLNTGNICVAKTSPPCVFNAYFDQFKKDFTVFLRCRANEIVPQGGMVLTIMGSNNSQDPLSLLVYLGLKLNEMVKEGLIGKKKLDTFNIPLYEPTLNEVEQLIKAEGSFNLQDAKVFRDDWDFFMKEANKNIDKKTVAAIISASSRAAMEPILTSHFGEGITEDLYLRFRNDVVDYMENYNGQFTNLVISLIKN